MSAARGLRKSATPTVTETVAGPFVWTFDDSLADCVADIEDTLRRAIVQLGDVTSIVVLIELSLPALRRCVDSGETIQPAWARFVERLSTRYGLPEPPRIRMLKGEGPLATLVIAYRS